MQCWFWNIDKSAQTFFSSELAEGRLRQGWGYDDNFDLRKIKDKLNMSLPLDKQEGIAWDHCNAMLSLVKPGDYVIVKNVPSSDRFSLARIAGNYDFSLAGTDDYGHILPVSDVIIFHKQSSVVPSQLVSALNREQHAIRVTHKHHDSVLSLALIKDVAIADSVEPFKEKLVSWRNLMITELKKIMERTLDHRMTERLVRELLRREDLDFTWTAGPSESGADFICSVQNRFGPNLKLAIQVKMHWGTHSDLTGINQLIVALQHHKADAGLLISTANELGEQLSQKIDETRKSHRIDVLYGQALYQRVLELLADPNYEIEE